MASELLPPGVDPTKVGAGPPPPGVVPNLVDPPSVAWAARVSVYATLPLMILFLALRLYVRVRSRILGFDDYVAVIATVCNVAYCGVTLAQFRYDIYGRHSWEVPVSGWTNEHVHIVLATVCLYNLAAIFTKVSLLVLYMRVFKVARVATIMIWAGIVFITLFYTICFIANAVFCFPRGSEDWYTAITQLRCGPNQWKLAAVQGPVGVITDFYTLAIPFFLVLRLQMSTSKKTAVAGIFLTGIMACAFSIAGTWARFRNFESAVKDYVWMSVLAQTFSIAELNVGLMCCCLPVIFVLFKSAELRFESTWVSITDWLRARSRGTSSSKITSPSDDHFKLAANSDISGRNTLPRVPKGTLSGLISFVRGRTRSEPQSGWETSTNNQKTESRTELQTINDYSYHTYLNDRPAGVGKSSDPTNDRV